MIEIMKVYVIILEDRHIDTYIEVFSDKEKAIERAKELRDEQCTNDIEESLTQEMIKDGWVYHCLYSCEGDKVTVVEVEVK